jgi:XTP/dITP diphosphohydrolase
LDRVKSLDFFTSNRSKVAEARLFLGPLGYRVNWRRANLLEPQLSTLEEVVKVKLVSAPLDADLAMVEDSGFFVHSLNGFPGVYSSYIFKALGCDGILRLLDNLPRDAHFEAVVGIRRGHDINLFKGMVQGKVSTQQKGRQGFGFDPIFVPEGSRFTMAELSRQEKVRISHRSRALASLAEWLRRKSRRP